MPGLRLWVRMRDATAQWQICCLQHGETESNVWNTFCMKLPYVAQQVGNAYFYRLTEIKELSGSLWWMHEGSNLLAGAGPWDVGCFDMWDWPESCVTKIWGLSHDHGFVLFLFATMGFHIARSGIFWPQHLCYKGSLMCVRHPKKNLWCLDDMTYLVLRCWLYCSNI